MTARKRFKRLVRARAGKTGESYTSALRHFRGETPKERAVSKPSERTLARCTFCGKSQDHVRRMIAGPGVFICDQCVILCMEIIGPAPVAEPVAEPDSQIIDPEVDGRVRRYLAEALARVDAGEGGPGPVVGRVEILSTANGIRIDVHTDRPGELIGRGGLVAAGLRAGLTEVVEGDVTLNVIPL